MPLRRCGSWLVAGALSALCCLAGSAGADGLLGTTGQPAAPAAMADAPATPPPAPGSPSAAVRRFYDHPGLEIAPAERGDFVDPARTVLDQSDRLRASGQGECLDPQLALDNVEPAQAELGRSLRMVEAVDGEAAKVVVAFNAAGTQHRLEWKLKKIGGGWKVSDLLSVTGEWALSQYQCQ